MAFKTPNKTSEYIRSLMKEETDPIYLEINKYADENFIPVLLPETASFLAQIIRLAKPKKILEIGTAIGYSAQIMLRNCDAQLYTIEMEEKRVDVAKKFFEEPAAVTLAYAFEAPDGLCGGPLAALVNAPLILTENENTAEAKAYVQEMGIDSGYVFGGTGRISEEAVEEIF